MKNYKLTICYDGSRYHGWEMKKGLDTIQGKIQAVLERMCQSEVKLIGAGRTDAGVHARAMVANVHMETAYSPEEIRAYLNRYLPDDIGIVEVREASERFHARLKAVGKTYCYTCYEGVSKPIFERKYTTVLDRPVDINKMKQAAAYLVGQHDFKSFCGNPKMKKSTVRNIYAIDIKKENGFITMSFHGNGFLQYMVRILSGTLLEVGYGRMEPQKMLDILEAKSRREAGPTAPPQGLCLMKIDY